MVYILLATYNGDKYLREQLDSILNQVYQYYKIIIRDDGSSDGTVDIIRNCAKKDNRIIFVNDLSNYDNKCDSNISFKGQFANFYYLLNYLKNCNADTDFVFLCDQDDIWNMDKLSLMIDTIKDNDGEPVIAYANMSIIDENDAIIKKNLIKYKDVKASKFTSFIYPKVYGCNMMLNKKAFDLLPCFDIDEKLSRMPHDWLLERIISIFGKVFYIDRVTMQYRRHSNNASTDSIFYDKMLEHYKIIKKIEGFDKNCANIFNSSLYSIAFIKEHYDCQALIDDLNSIEELIRTGGRKAVHLMRKLKISSGNILVDFARKCVLLSNNYKKYLIN